jgi:hypothetical protein
MHESIAQRNCQNCGADLTGNYCSRCGQKSTAVYDKSLKSLMNHFFEEFFTWDSRFFLSMKYLFTRPGYLTHEYISGRIQSYVSPVKLFLFTSFALFFIMIKTDPDSYKALVTDSDDSDVFKQFVLEQQSQSNESEDLFIDNFNEEINGNITLYLFVVLFLFSVLLKIVYFTKHIFYAEHIVFTLHFFTFTLWSFALGVFTQELSEHFVLLFLYVVPGIYLLIALKKVYHKTLWKAIIVCSFLTSCYWVLITGWVLGTVFISALRA